MTDEQRKQIGRMALKYANGKEYEKACADILYDEAFNSYVSGVIDGLSLSENRVKELEAVCKTMLTALQYMDEIHHCLPCGAYEGIAKAKKLLTHTDNER